MRHRSRLHVCAKYKYIAPVCPSPPRLPQAGTRVGERRKRKNTADNIVVDMDCDDNGGGGRKKEMPYTEFLCRRLSVAVSVEPARASTHSAHSLPGFQSEHPCCKCSSLNKVPKSPGVACPGATAGGIGPKRHKLFWRVALATDYRLPA